MVKPSAAPHLALMVKPVCRFAPSPNGPLHLGHAYSALCNRAVAARGGGRLLLRMEDIDRARCTPAFAAGIEDDLRWLGVGWEAPVVRQSERFPLYAAALDRLAARDLVYPCFCTRGDLVAATGSGLGGPRDPDGAPLYPGTCRALSAAARDRHAASRPFCLRLDMARALGTLSQPLHWSEFGEGAAARRVAADPSAWGDAVLRRKDVPASYHVAVVADDAAQGVTDVVRGRDLFAATGLHRLLQALLGLPAPRYHHHRLVLDAAGHKLSKSRSSRPLAAWRQAGATPSDIDRAIEAGLEP